MIKGTGTRVTAKMQHLFSPCILNILCLLHLVALSANLKPDRAAEAHACVACNSPQLSMFTLCVPVTQLALL